MAITYLTLSSPVQASNEKVRENLSASQLEVLSVVEARWQAWLDNDIEAYLAVHHETWQPWALDSPELDQKEDIPAFWSPVDDGEQMLTFRIEPIAVYYLAMMNLLSRITLAMK